VQLEYDAAEATDGDWPLQQAHLFLVPFAHLCGCVGLKAEARQAASCLGPEWGHGCATGAVLSSPSPHFDGGARDGSPRAADQVVCAARRLLPEGDETLDAPAGDQARSGRTRESKLCMRIFSFFPAVAVPLRTVPW
jgi:hypothetical protein